MGKMYRHDEYIDFKNCLLKMDESTPNYETLSNMACLMEVLAEMSPFDAASGVMTALQVVYNDDELDFILGFLSTMYESKCAQKADAGFEAGKTMKEYINNDIDIITDLFDSDDEFGEWR